MLRELTVLLFSVANPVVLLSVEGQGGLILFLKKPYLIILLWNLLPGACNPYCLLCHPVKELS